MSKYLTDKTSFYCPCNSFMVKASQNKVLWRGAPVLTTGAELSPLDPTCKILSASAPGTLCPKSFSPWLSVDQKHSAAGEALLTDSSKRTCISCGTVVQYQMEPLNMPGMFVMGLGGSTPSTSAVPDQEAQSGEEKPKAESEGGQEARLPAAQADEDDAARESKGQEWEERDRESEDEEEKKSIYKCPYCPEEKKKSCHLSKEWKKYFSDVKNSPDWDNSLKQLEKKEYRERYFATLPESELDPVIEKYNFQGCRDEFLDNTRNLLNCSKSLDMADRAFIASLRILLNNEGQNGHKEWNYQAHHLLPAKQIFREELFAGDLLRMANVCKYDVNNGRNGIMLISDSVNYEYGGPTLTNRKIREEDEIKKENLEILAYKLMGRHGIQWHKGPHNYSLDSEDIQELCARDPKYREEDFCNYVQALRKNAILLKIVKDIDKTAICPASFIGRVQRLSLKIKEMLGAFHANYRASFPYYVSRAAMFFAFQMPFSFRLITVSREAGGVVLHRVKCRLYEDGRKSVRILKNGTFYYPSGPDNDAKIACARFCENDEYFIFFGQTGRSTLPFNVEETFTRREGAGKNASTDPMQESSKTQLENYILQNMLELMHWVANTRPEQEYTPMKRAKMRIREMAL